MAYAPSGYPAYPNRDQRYDVNERRPPVSPVPGGYSYATPSPNRDVNESRRLGSSYPRYRAYPNPMRCDINEHEQLNPSVPSGYAGYGSRNPHLNVDQWGQPISPVPDGYGYASPIPRRDPNQREQYTPYTATRYTGHPSHNSHRDVHGREQIINSLLDEIIQNKVPIYLIYIPKMEVEGFHEGVH